MKTLSRLFLVVFVATCFSCEREISLEIPGSGSQFVVEGFIETNERPYFTLNRTIPLFDADYELDPANVVAKGAEAWLEDDLGNRYQMEEFCLSDLPEPFRQEAIRELGLSDTAALEYYCFYTNTEVFGQVGRTYTLTIDIEEQQLVAVTTIPEPIVIDSLWSFKEPEGIDSLRTLFARFQDPAGIANYYRYFTKRNSEPFYPNLFQSTTDDKIFDGQSVPAPFDRGYPKGADIEFDTYGKFVVGDTVIFKLSTIDKAHFEFWRTAQDVGSSGSGGVFSTPTQIISNVEGGLGIFGGYSPAIDTIIID